ncbi:MAG: hypothetical protein ACKVUT_05100 [Gaiella sp.]
MTRQRSFKRLVRSRMGKTGESYTAARAALLGPGGEAANAEAPVLATSEERIRERTGRGWEEWFDLLDGWGAAAWSHRELARRVAAELEIASLAWWAQAITVSYERARGGRAVGERADGFAISVSRTVLVPVERLFEALVDSAARERFLPAAPLCERTTLPPRSARYDWGANGSRVQVTFDAKGEAKATITVEHARLADAAEADRMKVYWRDGLLTLKSQLEAGAEHA